MIYSIYHNVSVATYSLLALGWWRVLIATLQRATPAYAPFMYVK